MRMTCQFEVSIRITREPFGPADVPVRSAIASTLASSEMAKASSLAPRNPCVE